MWASFAVTSPLSKPIWSRISRLSTEVALSKSFLDFLNETFVFEAECDISVSKLLGFETFPFF